MLVRTTPRKIKAGSNLESVWRRSLPSLLPCSSSSHTAETAGPFPPQRLGIFHAMKPDWLYAFCFVSVWVLSSQAFFILNGSLSSIPPSQRVYIHPAYNGQHRDHSSELSLFPFNVTLMVNYIFISVCILTAFSSSDCTPHDRKASICSMT